MHKIIAMIATLGMCLVASTAMAQGQPQCGERDNVLMLLAKKYQETPIAAGVTNTGSLVEVLAAHKGDTWSLIVTTPQGMSCLVAAGEGWRDMKQSTLDPEA